MPTMIYATKKLEKLIPKMITVDAAVETSRLGKWNATVFLVDRKKCWLFTNGLTKYSVILPNVKTADHAQIEILFKNTFVNQLIYDGIIVDFEALTSSMGQLRFMRTDNDRVTTGFQNQRVYELEVWKEEFRTLEHMPMTDLANRMNGIPIHIGKSKRFADFTDAICEMKKALSVAI